MWGGCDVSCVGYEVWGGCDVSCVGYEGWGGVWDMRGGVCGVGWL